MARALQDILTELNAVYNPQRDVYNQQVAALPEQQNAENAGLDQAKTDSFQQITNGANRRGLLFSGIPLGEQASYLGSTYLPSVANLKAKYAQQRFNLQDALAKVTQDQYNTAYGIQGKEQANDTALASERASAAGGASPSFGGGGGGSGVLGASAQTDPLQQAAYNDVYSRVKQSDDNALRSDYNATYQSAIRGNQKDKYKLILYSQLRPDLFQGTPANAVNFSASY